MVGNDNSRTVRATVGLSVVTLVLAAATCTAPDARPTPEPNIEPMPDASDGADASDAMDMPDVPIGPDEPPAGDGLWAAGFGEGSKDQRAYDVATDLSGEAFVTTIGFAGFVQIPPIGTLTSTSARNIAVVKAPANGGPAVWAQQITCTAEIIRSMVEVDALGNTVVVGGFNGTITIAGLPPTANASNYDVFIAKFDPTGMPLWIKTFGEKEYGYATDVAVDGTGNIIVVGVTEGPTYSFGKTKMGMDILPPSSTGNSFNDDIFIAKFDPDGNAVWGKRLGLAAGNQIGIAGTGPWDDPPATVVASQTDGSIILGGSFRGTMLLGADPVMSTGKDDAFVAKFDTDGNNKWHVEFGDTNHTQRVRSLAYAPTGEVVLTGSFQGTITVNGVNAKQTLVSHQGTEDVLLMKLDPQGKALWSHGYGHAGRQIGTCVRLDDKGQPLVVGDFVGGIDFFGNGAVINASFGNTTDLFAAKFGSSGKAFWAHSYGDLEGKPPESQNAGAVALCKDGMKNVAVVAGMVTGTIAIGDNVTPITSLGLEDALLFGVTY